MSKKPIIDRLLAMEAVTANDEAETLLDAVDAIADLLSGMDVVMGWIDTRHSDSASDREWRIDVARIKSVISNIKGEQ